MTDVTDRPKSQTVREQTLADVAALRDAGLAPETEDEVTYDYFAEAPAPAAEKKKHRITPQVSRISKQLQRVEVRAAARLLVNDPEYVVMLRKRMIMGTAGQMEILLWHYAYGKPTEHIEIKDTTNSFAELSDDELRAEALAIAKDLSPNRTNEDIDDTLH